MLSTGRLSQTLIHPRRLLTLLRKVARDVTMKNSQFVPLYTEHYHYYETNSVSFTNTEDYLDQNQLNSCLKLHTDYLCPNLRLTAFTYVLSCAAAVFQTTPDDSLIHSICQFTYYEHFTPPPAVLETQDEILLANLPPKWQLVCANQIDRPIPLDSAIFAIVNKNDLCTCGISAQHIFLYKSMHMCTTPDASVTLYYMHNKALLAYDTSSRKLDKDAEQYHIKVPEYRAPDISYDKKTLDVL